LRNGDQLTCEIKNLQQARLSISTDPLGSASVHWGEVLGVASPRDFEITLSSGDRYYGSLGRTTVAGEAALMDGGTTITSVSLGDVTTVVPIGSRFWSRMDGNVDVGFSLAQANLETHLTLNGSTTYRSSKSRIASSLASQLTSREDADQTSR